MILIHSLFPDIFHSTSYQLKNQDMEAFLTEEEENINMADELNKMINVFINKKDKQEETLLLFRLI